MHRRFSPFVKSPSASGSLSFDHDDETDAKASTIPLPPASSKIKRVDYFYSRWREEWKYRDMNSWFTVETLPGFESERNDPWKDYCFVVVRTIPRQERTGQPKLPTFEIVIKSEYLLKACQDVILTWPGVSWNTDPVKLEPETFLTFLHSFNEYRDALTARKRRSDRENHVLSSVNLLLSFLHTDYRITIATIERLTARGEITFDLLYAILVPRTLIVVRCAITGLERLFRLHDFTRYEKAYRLTLEGVDLVDHPMMQTVGVGRVEVCMYILDFKGAMRIDALDAFPLAFHAAEAQVREVIMRRGQKWVSMIGVHHMQYSGIAALQIAGRLMRHNVPTFHRLNANYAFSTPHNGAGSKNMGGHMGQPFEDRALVHSQAKATAGALVYSQANATAETTDLSPEDLLLTPTVVYGFSLSDKIWLEFNVTKVAPVQWNADAFANLVLPADRKILLRSLVEAHDEEAGFDDFVKGKGAGLVVNLFGPPGVGKTLSAEATSEHVMRPLYVIGGGDLGTRAADLDIALERVFDVATEWKAIVLIDEVALFPFWDIVGDSRSNALQADYYRGILFLTTNRVQAFDEAFLSRIHVALHFDGLSEASRAQVWRSFIARAGVQGIDDAQIAMLAKREVNGRQIKNAVRTAHSLAQGRKESIGLGHFSETLDAMDEFTKQLEGMKLEAAPRAPAQERSPPVEYMLGNHVA
ncbi:hypothetical protein B0H14DRAFT_2719773 [Mycena olivaceomarginata]|nr:hypothetical protein B0H14DRAFT_2719773 [Mycena olivaceomarginata]